MFNNKDKVKNTVTSNPNYRVITIEQPMSLAAEAYRRIKVSLDFAQVDENLQVIQVCSSTQGEGKSTTALNVAATYIEDGKKAIIVDLDLRRPKLHRTFNVHNKDGVTDVLAGNVKLKDAIKKSDKIHFDLLNSGTNTVYPTALLGSKAIKDMFAELRTMYDVIIVDCPPILAVTDATIISSMCDGCLFVVSQEKTEKNAAKEAVKVLRKNKVNLLGVVYTAIDTSKGSFNSKYKYYQEYHQQQDLEEDNK